MLQGSTSRARFIDWVPYSGGTWALDKILYLRAGPNSGTTAKPLHYQKHGLKSRSLCKAYPCTLSLPFVHRHPPHSLYLLSIVRVYCVILCCFGSLSAEYTVMGKGFPLAAPDESCHINWNLSSHTCGSILQSTLWSRFF